MRPDNSRSGCSGGLPHKASRQPASTPARPTRAFLRARTSPMPPMPKALHTSLGPAGSRRLMSAPRTPTGWGCDKPLPRRTVSLRRTGSPPNAGPTPPSVAPPPPAVWARVGGATACGARMAAGFGRALDIAAIREPPLKVETPARLAARAGWIRRVRQPALLSGPPACAPSIRPGKRAGAGGAGPPGSSDQMAASPSVRSPSPIRTNGAQKNGCEVSGAARSAACARCRASVRVAPSSRSAV